MELKELQNLYSEYSKKINDLWRSLWRNRKRGKNHRFTRPNGRR